MPSSRWRRSAMYSVRRSREHACLRREAGRLFGAGSSMFIAAAAWMASSCICGSPGWAISCCWMRRSHHSLVGMFFAGVLFPDSCRRRKIIWRSSWRPMRAGGASEALADARRLYAAKFVEYAARGDSAAPAARGGFHDHLSSDPCAACGSEALKEGGRSAGGDAGGANCEGEMGGS